jgi:chemotaxis protein CheX
MMNIKFLNPFLEAAAEVLKAEVGLTPTRGNISLQKSALSASEITVLISIIGQVQGVVLYGMSTATGLAFVSKIMDQQFTEFDGLAQSGIGELGNVISGRAAINLSAAGFETTISPPTLIIGTGAQISTLDFQRIVVPLDTRVGQLIVHLAVREVPDTPVGSPLPVTSAAPATLAMPVENNNGAV